MTLSRPSKARREFLRSLATASVAGAAAPTLLSLFAASSASAQTASDYRAVVCIYLGGGNDHLSTLIPIDPASYTAYQRARTSLAIPRANALPVASLRAQGGLQVGLHPNLAGIASLYSQRRVAIIPNIGPLVAPTTRADLQAGRVAYPSQIGSHNDQAATWLTLSTRGRAGWGGRIADMIADGNGASAMFTSITASGGASSFLTGLSTSEFAVSSGGIPSAFFSSDPVASAAVLGGGASSRRNLLERAYVQVHERLRDGGNRLASNALADSSVSAPPSQNSMAAQLRTVARIMGGNRALGIRRQVFYVETSGFDTHGSQNERHADLMSSMNAAFVYFDEILRAQGLQDSVALFTTSEFGRTLASNGDGTDHGWGGHHFVFGGPAVVNGGDIFGQLPITDPSGPDFINSLTIPGISVEQFGATFASWMGLSASSVRDIFPTVGRFATANLGFLK